MWTLIAMAIAYVIVCLDITGTAVLLPAMHKSFDMLFSEMQWIINIYVVVMAACLLVAGKLAVRIGYKNLMIIGLLIFAFGSWMCGFAGSVDFEIAGRAVQGIGAAVIFPIAMAIIKATAPKNKLPFFLSMMLAINSFSFSSGGLVAAFIHHISTWRWFFYINIPIALFAAALIAFAMRPIVIRSKIKIDWIGLILLFFSILLVVFALMDGPMLTWSSYWVIGSFVLAFICFALFVLNELKVSVPLIEMSILRDGMLTRIFITVAIMQVAFMLFNFIAIFVQVNWHFSVLAAGAIGLYIGGALLVMTLLVKPMLKIISEHTMMLYGQIAVLLSVICYAVSLHTGFVMMAIGLILFGASLPWLLIPSLSISMSRVSEDNQAMASSLIYAWRYVGGAIGFAIQGSIINAHRHFNQHQVMSVNQFFYAMLVVVFFAVIGLLLMIKNWRRSHRDLVLSS
jgi:MFS family permease